MSFVRQEIPFKFLINMKIEVTQEHILLMQKAGGKLAELVTQLRPTSFEEVCTILGESPDKYEPVEGVETPQDVALRKIKAIVKVMNKGETADFTNENQAKYYPYFDLSNGVSLHYVRYNHQYSFVPPSSCYISSEDCKYAVETFFEIYKTAFTNENN